MVFIVRPASLINERLEVFETVLIHATVSLRILMCILFIHTGGPEAGGYRLILANNRDEFFDRPAAVAAPWDEDKDVLGGRDMEPGREGGTWLAASPARRRLAALLNLPGVTYPENPRGRGLIVSNFVLGNMSTEEYLEEFHRIGSEYSAFNLVTVHINETSSSVHHYSSFTDETLDYGSCGVLGFSNSCPSRPLKKVCAGRRRFQGILESWSRAGADKETLINELLELLQWDETHLPDPELELRRPNAPAGLAAVCVKVPNTRYGTRTHTIVLVDAEGTMDYLEWTMVPGKEEWQKTHLKRHI